MARGTRDVQSLVISLRTSPEYFTLVLSYTKIKSDFFTIEMLELWSEYLNCVYVDTIGSGVKQDGSTIEMDTV